MTVDRGGRIVKVEFFRSATASARILAEKILTSHLSAQLVGESESGHSSATLTIAR